ncbi:MAG: helix-turn-helix transcriptional regulator [Oscillospiraceae bacterium]|nr:helix-turn-helix transcriptional regulator [Oscillospiraceae bacterium]
MCFVVHKQTGGVVARYNAQTAPYRTLVLIDRVPVNGDRLVGRIHAREGYLAHAFKAETGMSPCEYLTHIRCTRACELIRYTAMKFGDIADVTGFCCANDMSRKIREHYGLSPTEIRFSSPSQTP